MGITNFNTVQADSFTKSDADVVAQGTRQAHVADASVAHALNATFSDTEVEGALNALGTKINSILAALEEFGINASS